MAHYRTIDRDMKYEEVKFNRKHSPKKVRKHCSIENRDLWDNSHLVDHFKHKKIEKKRKELKSRDKHSKIILEDE